MTLADVSAYLRQHPADVPQMREQALEVLEAVARDGEGAHALAVNTLLYELVSAKIDHRLRIQKGLIMARMRGVRLGRPQVDAGQSLGATAGMSNAEAARVLCVSRSTIKRWRRCVRGGV